MLRFCDLRPETEWVIFDADGSLRLGMHANADIVVKCVMIV